MTVRGGIDTARVLRGREPAKRGGQVQVNTGCQGGSRREQHTMVIWKVLVGMAVTPRKRVFRENPVTYSVRKNPVFYRVYLQGFYRVYYRVFTGFVRGAP